MVMTGVVCWRCTYTVIKSYHELNHAPLTHARTQLDKPVGEADYDYDDIYNSFGSHDSYDDIRIFEFGSFDNYTSPDIRGGCLLTVIIVDPRTPLFPINHPMWFALESVALHVPYGCIVFHTSSCQLIRQTSNMPTVPTNQQKVHVLAKSIYLQSLPLFRRMMERGQVRINILDSEKYGLSCDNFGNGNAIFMNVNFWLDEFNDVDSDILLTMQSDTVLCRYFDFKLWKHFAYVGAPWPPNTPLLGSCDNMRRIWHDKFAMHCNGFEKHQADESISKICTANHGGLQGNGGLSIRNRHWMVEAKQRCPFQDGNEDVYFSVILNALNATMPTAFEAALFSVEHIFPEQTFEHFFSYEKEEMNKIIVKLWGDDGLSTYERMQRQDTYYENLTKIENLPLLHTIPVGFHQAWKFSPQEIFSGPQIQAECKFMKFMF